ncbi:TPA: secretion system protein E, partial [archaeon]|nr:secretion system protein E [Candidatus Naiadarchaeales archaeon SRR2090159.bin1288]
NLAYSWNPPKDLYEYSGRSAILRSIMEIIGKTSEGMTQEIERRIEVIEWMYHNGIRDYKNVGRVIAEYYQNPKGLLQRIGKI